MTTNALKLFCNQIINFPRGVDLLLRNSGTDEWPAVSFPFTSTPLETLFSWISSLFDKEIDQNSAGQKR